MRSPMLRIIKQKLAVLAIATLVLPLTSALAQVKPETAVSKPEPARAEPAHPEHFTPEQQASKGSVTIGGNVINYERRRPGTTTSCPARSVNSSLCCRKWNTLP
jgi:hypothetical protein